MPPYIHIKVSAPFLYSKGTRLTFVCSSLSETCTHGYLLLLAAARLAHEHAFTTIAPINAHTWTRTPGQGFLPYIYCCEFPSSCRIAYWQMELHMSNRAVTAADLGPSMGGKCSTHWPP
jgi:hypothetical protein